MRIIFRELRVLFGKHLVSPLNAKQSIAYFVHLTD